MTEQSSRPNTTATRPPNGLDQTLAEVESLREQLDILKQELVWSNRLTTLGTMAAVLAHEYNNLLTPISSYAQLALANPDDRALAQKALEIAVQGVTQAQTLAEVTLGFARPDEPEQAHCSPVRQALDGAVICIGGVLKHDGICLQLDVPETLSVAMRSLELQQVLINLMDNARKAMAQQRPPRKLRVTGRREGDQVVIDVCDNGPGIPDTIINHLFEAFVTHPGSEQGDTGTGLGLRICKDLVESAGGQIEVDTHQAIGTTFRLILPPGMRTG